MDRRDFIKKATMAAAGAAVVSPVSAMINNVTGGKTPKAASEREQDQVGLSPAEREQARPKVKVLLINGSPRTDGNTFCCLKEIEATLQKHRVESEIVQIGRKPVRMCINCGGCRQNNGAGSARTISEI